MSSERDRRLANDRLDLRLRHGFVTPDPEGDEEGIVDHARPSYMAAEGDIDGADAI